MTGRRNRRKDSSRFNVWRSYSDMMAGLLMLFVLIMCVTLFQAQKNYVEKLAEQEEKMILQNEYTSELLEKQSELAAQESQLKTQDELLAEQQKRLEAQNLTMEELQATLAEQAALLEEKTETLSQQQTTLEQQQAALNAKTEELKDKQAQIDKIVGVKAEVIEALRQEFKSNDMNVTIDSQTGALVLDSNIMFAYDDVELSEEGREVLSKVLPIYCKVLLDDKYLPNVAEIIIDGYTDTDGSYEYNLVLSQQRSLAVAQYLLEIKEGFLDGNDTEVLKEKLTVNGHSMSHPVLDENGNVDKDASRRVEVKFRLKDEEMINELHDLME
ncbi:MAG: OmpA family protein [Lachnospiraceae bacterium]|nr:OmpA family protein [Lachnospiraceae bacterium]